MGKLFRFAKPTVTRIDLSDGEWIEVMEELSVGAQRKAYTSAIKGTVQTPDGETRTEYDAQKLSFALVNAYLVDWSARDDHDKPVDISDPAKRAAVIEALTPDAFAVLDEAIDAHIARVKAAKKTTSEAASSSSATSPSVAG